MTTPIKQTQPVNPNTIPMPKLNTIVNDFVLKTINHMNKYVIS